MNKTLEQIIKLGYRDFIVPILPTKAKLSPNSKISPQQLGKIPGVKGQSGWIGLKDWPNYKFDEDDFTHTGIGIRTKGFAFIDIDLEDEDQVEKVYAIAVACLGTPSVRTRKGSNRIGLLYKAETDIKKSRIPFEDKTAVEVLGDGQQFVCYGLHPSGEPYEMDLLPLNELAVVTEQQITGFLKNVLNYAISLDLETSVKTKVSKDGVKYESSGKTKDLEGDHILHSYNYGEITVEEVFSNPELYHLEVFQEPMEPDYRDGQVDIARFYNNEDKPVIHSMAHGGINYFFNPDEELNDISDLSDLERALLENPGTNVTIDWPPGLMGELAKEAHEMAVYQYKTLSIYTVLGGIAGIVGRKYNVDDQHLALYISVMMDTGMGKQAISQIIQKMLIDTGSGSLGGGLGRTFLARTDHTGPKALIRDLTEGDFAGMSKISIVTESGILQQQKAGNRQGLDAMLLSAMTTAGASYGGLMLPSMYSDEKSDLPILYAPAITVIHESTPHSFVKALLDKDAQRSGMLGRHITTRITGDKPLPNTNRRRDFSKPIKERINALLSECSKVQDNRQVSMEKLTCYEKLDFMYDQQVEYIHQENKFKREGKLLEATICSRAFVNAMKVAGVVAAFNGEKEISKESFDWAVKLIDEEVESITSTFTHESSDDIYTIIEGIIGPAIIKILNNSYSVKRHQEPRVLRRKGIFRKATLNQILRNNQTMKDLASRKDGSVAVSGLDKVLRVMVRDGLLYEVPDNDLKKCGLSRATVAYRISDDFVSLMEI
jgi:hypothetical protein